jgi:hypothetical protein
MIGKTLRLDNDDYHVLASCRADFVIRVQLATNGRKLLAQLLPTGFTAHRAFVSNDQQLLVLGRLIRRH